MVAKESRQADCSESAPMTRPRANILKKGGLAESRTGEQMRAVDGGGGGQLVEVAAGGEVLVTASRAGPLMTMSRKAQSSAGGILHPASRGETNIEGSNSGEILCYRCRPRATRGTCLKFWVVSITTSRRLV